LDTRKVRVKTIGFVTVIVLAFATASAGAADKLLQGTPHRDSVRQGENTVWRRCLTPRGNDLKLGGLGRDHPWSLPTGRLADDFDTTIHCLVLRYDFQYEATDDPNTTGRGRMDLSRPLDTLSDSAYTVREGYLIDPPPHDSAYFDAHLKALNRYWEQVSEGRVHLEWDIYPPYRDSVYELPYPMSHYGRCDNDSVIYGLERYFIDCLQLADTAHLERPGDSARWNIDFSKYEALFLFHAGSDRQSDIGFPRTCSDLYTGFIKFGDTVWVDNGSSWVRTALMMPETVVQDNRITALNTVLAHEFGHQLGLVDIYDTRTFMSQIGDFGLMDNAGFGTSLDFGFSKGNVFGTIPVYPCGWSRAYLGFVDVRDIRNDTSDVQIVAAGLFQDARTKVARIPISETEYYLIEDRTIDTDNKETALLADSATSVIQGPVNLNRQFTGEYDFLLPGSGMLIYLIDEGVAALDYDGDGVNNFADNQLQWWVPGQKRKFLTLIEGDGLVGFGGYFRSGYGRPEDMYRDDRNHTLTPNTNPPSIDNTGNNTHVYLTDIRRDTATVEGTVTYDDRVMFFDFELDRRVAGFPVRAGVPLVGLAPIADDLNSDSVPEIIMASGKILSVVTSDGRDFIRSIRDYDTIVNPLYYDTAVTYVNTGAGYNPAALYPVPVFAETPNVITTCPVTGRFHGGETLVAIGYPSDASQGRVMLYRSADDNGDARADSAGESIATVGWPIALSFGDRLDILTDSGYIYRYDSLGGLPKVYIDTTDHQFHGIGRIGERLVVVGGDSAATRFTIISDFAVPTSFAHDGRYAYGPVIADLNRDEIPEIIAFTPDGLGLFLSVDTTAAVPTFSVLGERATGNAVTANPIVGDVDGDGYLDVIVGGVGTVLAYNALMIEKTDFPIEIDDRYPDSIVLAAPVMADIEHGGRAEVIFSTSAGNVYAHGDRLAAGFPLSSGRQIAGVNGSSPVLFADESGGKMGYLGGDGWFYAWEVDADTTTNYWPMNGGGPSGHFAFPTSKLADPTPLAARFDESRYYNYPNPVRGNETTLRYYLGETAESVAFDIYDLSGVKVAQLSGSTLGLTDNEVVWDCSGVSPGVYRCMIEVEFADGTETAFTDIAIVR
jgi:M6 family metalloprotease-like protein